MWKSKQCTLATLFNKKNILFSPMHMTLIIRQRYANLRRLFQIFHYVILLAGMWIDEAGWFFDDLQIQKVLRDEHSIKILFTHFADFLKNLSGWWWGRLVISARFQGDRDTLSAR